jgi:NADH-quinone oxidoreductase subunit L
MREMGGLRKVMPWTYATFLIASISIVGIWPLAGFYSKEGILTHAWDHQRVLFFVAMFTVFLTAFYMFRAVFLTFGGKYRGSVSASHSSGSHGPSLRESPLVMVIPLALLAIMAVIAGWLPVGEFLGAEAEGYFHPFTTTIAWVSLALGGLGIFLAYAIYGAKWLSAESLRRRFAPVYTVLSRKYWFDELYERVFLFKVLIGGVFRLFEWFDTHVVDGIVNGIAGGIVVTGSAIRRLQTGQLQAYGIAISFGILVIALCLAVFS